MQSLVRTLCRAGNGASSSKFMHLGSLSPICGRELSTISSSTIQQLALGNKIFNKNMATEAHAIEDSEGDNILSPDINPSPRIKFKRLDKTAKQIMSILDKEEVEKVRSVKDIPDIRPGCIVELKVEVPENKRRVSTVKGIVIARRNAGLNSTFRLRRLVAGVGVESVYPLYSPNIKDVKIVDRKKVRRAKLYYLRDRMNALKK